MFCHDGIIHATTPENAAMDLRVQGFDSTIHHFRKVRVVTDFGHGNPVFFEQPERAAGGEQFNALA